MKDAVTLYPVIDLESLALTIPGHEGRFTGDEWRHMQLPPCPVCGETIVADRVEVTTREQAVRHYLFGRWECPNECDPRRAR